MEYSDLETPEALAIFPRMHIIIAAAIWAIASTQAWGWSFCDGYLTPPAEHQRPPTQPYVIHKLAPQHVTFLCGVSWLHPSVFGGCVEDREDGPWIVFVRDDLPSAELGCIVRHELSHIPPNDNAHPWKGDITKGYRTGYRRAHRPSLYAPRLPQMQPR